MITRMRMKGFKSWQDTGDIRCAGLTGFFGTNSSGKTALIQAPLLLKQSAESSDRFRVLHTGDPSTYVDLGTYHDIAFHHRMPTSIGFEVDWSLPEPLKVKNPEQPNQVLFSIPSLEFKVEIGLGEKGGIWVSFFEYGFSQDQTRYRFRMQEETPGDSPVKSYRLDIEGFNERRSRGRPSTRLAPVRYYGFPDQVNYSYENLGFLADLVLAWENLLRGIYYLGPLREYPQRSYTWAGERYEGVGRRGEQAVHALLSATARGEKVRKSKGGPRNVPVARRVSQWLKTLGLLEQFDLKPIAENRREYEVRVRRSTAMADVLITDVGFGVSQILPVLVLCYYAPEGSTLIFEQPEIHLHPMVQAGLADLFIDVIQTRNLQIILESHSEHLLTRLQRRIAEEVISVDDVALYFAQINGGESKLHPLQLNLYGDITNWPENFFGNELGDRLAMAEATLGRYSTQAAHPG